jgi:hypothetical protein
MRLLLWNIRAKKLLPLVLSAGKSLRSPIRVCMIVVPHESKQVSSRRKMLTKRATPLHCMRYNWI